MDRFPVEKFPIAQPAPGGMQEQFGILMQVSAPAGQSV
jgi:hypothetical protein